jgi:hypothetical protein
MTINLSKTTGRPRSTSPALISLIVRVSIHRFYPSSQSSITQEIYFYFYKATVSRLGREAEANPRASYYGPHAGKSQTTPQIPHSLP